MFRSAAYIYGPRTIGVVLTGALDDGTAGLWTIKLRGGTAIVQEPSEALVRSMPLNALDNVEVDYKLPVTEVGELLGRLVREPAGPAPKVTAPEDEKTAREIHIARERDALEENTLQLGQLSPFTCPECRGVLGLLRDGKIVRFRCHTGHAYSADSLLASNGEDLEARLWDAVRASDESVFLLNRLGEEFAKAGNTAAAERCFDQARGAHERSRPMRDAATGSQALNVQQLREEEASASAGVFVQRGAQARERQAEAAGHLVEPRVSCSALINCIARLATRPCGAWRAIQTAADFARVT